jgi:hypothetical protein
MAFLLGGSSVLGVGMSREKIESLMRAMNQSNVEMSISEEFSEDDLKETPTESGGA